MKYTRSRYRVNKTLRFRLLTDQQKDEIYHAAVEILERTGARIYSQEAREILKKGGCWIDGENVRFPSGLTEWAVRTAPSRILIYNRNGEKAMEVGSNNTYFGPGPTNTYHMDVYTEERRTPVTGDNENVAKVCDYLENIDFVMDLGTPRDVTLTLSDVYAFRAMVTNTTKPVVHWGFDIDQYNDIVEIASIIAGGLEELQKRPFIALYSESSPPLVHSGEAINKAIFAAKKRLPIIYTPCVIAGATAPATLAGTIAQGLAESLPGVIVSQLIREGSPIIIGGVYGIMDMKTTVYSYGSPEFQVMQAGIAEVAHYIGMPVFGTAGCTDSHILDAQAAAEAAMSILMAALSGANLVHDVGYTASGATGSLFQLVMGNEIIGMVKRIIRGFSVNEYTLAVDEVVKAKPGGEHVTSTHTYNNFRKETWFPGFMDRWRYNEWKTMKGAKSMGDKIKEKTKKILKTHSPPELPEKILEEIDAVIKEAEERELKKAEKSRSKKRKR
ncbi:MAG: trimethylamine methyltransferase [Spirochaetes bacterium]|nr:MAG: trimethylamine methyltransferase [Spirochaetota bacterium]